MVLTREQAKEMINEAFKMMDTDGSGFLEKKEIHELAVMLHQKWTNFKENNEIGESKPFNEEMFEKGFALMDKSGDGKISHHEFEHATLNMLVARGLIEE